MRSKLFSILFLCLFSAQVFAAVSTIWAPQQIVSSGDMSGSVSSTAVSLTNAYQYSVQATYTGSPVGSLELQVSNDIQDCASVTNWSSIAASVQAISAAGSYMWNVINANYHCIRLVYTRTSGTGTLNAIYGSK